MTISIRMLVLATRNPGKKRELHPLLHPLGFEVITLDAAGVSEPLPEDQDTFAGNAAQKARFACERTGLPAIADDSGLEVDALGGAPGVLSARYAGHGHDDAANNAKLLEALRDVPEDKRTARFRCAIAYVTPSGLFIEAEGTVEGRILTEPRGTNGFGYDPYFFVSELRRGMAELSPLQKSAVSHRGRALRAFALKLKSAPHAGRE